MVAVRVDTVLVRGCVEWCGVVLTGAALCRVVLDDTRWSDVEQYCDCVCVCVCLCVCV